MRVGIFYRDFMADGGIPRETELLSRALADHGCTVVVYCYGSGVGERSVAPWPGLDVRVFRAPPGRWFGRRNPFFIHSRLRNVLESNEDHLSGLLLMGSFIPENFAVSRSARRGAIPYIVSIGDAFSPPLFTGIKGVKKGFYYSLFERRVVENAAAIRLYSDEQRAHLEARGCSVRNFFTLTEGIDWETIEAEDRQGESVVWPWRTPTEGRSPIIGFMGRLAEYQKGLDVLLRGWMEYRRNGGDGRLFLAGPGDQISLHRHLTDDLSESVEFLGVLQGASKGSFLKSLDVFVHPSRHEGVPRVVREALAVGCPVVVTPGTNLHTLVKESGAGWVTSPDPESLASTLFHVREAVVIGQIANYKEGAEKAASQLEWSHIAAKFLTNAHRYFNGREVRFADVAVPGSPLDDAKCFGSFSTPLIGDRSQALDGTSLGTTGEFGGVLSLLGERVAVLHGLEIKSGQRGGDVDCAVRRLDPTWPLRLPRGLRLCQELSYDVGARYWVLDLNGETLALDTMDDPKGLGRYSIPTSELLGGDTLEAPGATRAVYLTLKRLRKGVDQGYEWISIRSLAMEDEDSYRRVLHRVLPAHIAGKVAEELLGMGKLSPDLLRRARRSQRLSRYRRQGGVLLVPLKQGLRVLRRLRRPTGLTVLVVGPDGSGKSTLAEGLPSACRGLFRRHRRFHFRPGLFPRPGSLVRRAAPDFTQPHARMPHGRTLSLLLLGYYWLDFLLGSWFRLLPLRARTGLVILERGWPDLVVDPRRYRLCVPAVLVRVLGRLLPRPDMTIVLHAPSDMIRSRKNELPESEMKQQASAWRELGRQDRGLQFLDASGAPEQLVRTAREMIVKHLHSRAMRRVGGGWLNLPSSSTARWRLPRSPRGAARNSLLLYQPMTRRAMAGWWGAKMLAGVGGFRLLPLGSPIPEEVLEVIGPHLRARSTVAVAKANHPGRYVAMIHSDNEPQAVAKVATTPEGRARLEAEFRAISGLAPLLAAPLKAPRLILASPGLIISEAVRWRLRPTPWRLPTEVAFALGAFSAAGGSGSGALAHGDFVPWNLLWTSNGWVLCDWEDARNDAPPFFDVLHWLIRTHALLGHPSQKSLLRGLEGEGWIGRSLNAFAEGAGLPRGDLQVALHAYLEYETAPPVSAADGARRISRAAQTLETALRGSR